MSKVLELSRARHGKEVSMANYKEQRQMKKVNTVLDRAKDVVNSRLSRETSALKRKLEKLGKEKELSKQAIEDMKQYLQGLNKEDNTANMIQQKLVQHYREDLNNMLQKCKYLTSSEQVKKDKVQAMRDAQQTLAYNRRMRRMTLQGFKDLNMQMEARTSDSNTPQLHLPQLMSASARGLYHTESRRSSIAPTPEQFSQSPWPSGSYQRDLSTPRLSRASINSKTNLTLTERKDSSSRLEKYHGKHRQPKLTQSEPHGMKVLSERAKRRPSLFSETVADSIQEGSLKSYYRRLSSEIQNPPTLEKSCSPSSSQQLVYKTSSTLSNKVSQDSLEDKQSNKHRLTQKLQQLSYHNTTMDPFEALSCRYLRLNPSTVDELEHMCVLMGVDPGIHAHMSSQDVEDYYNTLSV